MFFFLNALFQGIFNNPLGSNLIAYSQFILKGRRTNQKPLIFLGKNGKQILIKEFSKGFSFHSTVFL